MSLVLTRHVGEALVLWSVARAARLFVVSINEDAVRLAITAPPDIRIMRQELLTEEDLAALERLGATP